MAEPAFYEEQEPQQDLDGAISQQITLGEKDPVMVARKVIALYGRFWVRNELAARDEDIVADLARRKLGSQRRNAAARITPGKPMTSEEMKLKSTWVPRKDGTWEWKSFAAFTADDHDARAAWYEKQATADMRTATWHRRIAEMLREDKVKTTGALKRELPPLPEDDEIEWPS